MLVLVSLLSEKCGPRIALAHHQQYYWADWSALFLRQVIVELRKVIWPTRKELITYTTVVIVFVVIIAAIVAVLDYVFTMGVLAIFG